MNVGGDGLLEELRHLRITQKLSKRLKQPRVSTICYKFSSLIVPPIVHAARPTKIDSRPPCTPYSGHASNIRSGQLTAEGWD